MVITKKVYKQFFQSSTIFPPTLTHIPCIHASWLKLFTPNLLLMKPCSYCCAGSFCLPPHIPIRHPQLLTLWILQKIHYCSYFVNIFFSSESLKYQNLIILKLCYPFLMLQTNRERVCSVTCTCVAIAPLCSCTMFKTIFTWIIFQRLYL